MLIFLVLILFCHSPISLYADSAQTAAEEKSPERKKNPEPSQLLKIGNLAFPVSQQPTPLISFGQNLIEENHVDIQLQAGEFKGKNEYFIDGQASIIYGFTNNFSIYLNVPSAIRYKRDHHHSSGIQDIIVQLEYAPFTKEYYTYYDQMSFVGNVSFPTGSLHKNPNTGIGSHSFFIGAVYSRMGINWFNFASYGGIFTTSHHHNKIGDVFLYEYGIGRRIFNTDYWLYDWMVEFNGIYAGRNRIRGQIDPNSGGNILYVTPSLFISSKKHLTFQIGLGFPLIQQLFGHQNRKEFLLQTKISCNF